MKNTIKKHTDFDFQEILPAAMPAFLMKFRPKRYDSGQFGLVATKRTFRKATDRNRAKRLLREWLRLSGRPEHVDVLLVARAPILETNMPDGMTQMKKALKRIR